MFCVQSRIHFQSYGWFIRLRLDCQLRLASARIRIFGKLGRQNVSRFIGRALFNGGSFSALTGEIDSAGAFAGAWYVSPALSCAVLIEHARAGRPSMAMIGMRRRCSWSSRVGCASARKLFFSSARWGCGPEGGRGLAGRAITSTRGRKNGILILGRR